MDNPKRDKMIIVILMLFSIIFTFFGASLAYWNWETVESQKTNIVFTLGHNFSCAADGGGDITQADAFIAPSSCTNSEHAIKREVLVTPTITSSGLTINMDLWLNVDKLDSGLSNSVNFKYSLTTSSTSCTEGVISSGTFNGNVAGDQVHILNKNYNGSTSETYYLYIWLDAEETSTSTMDQSFSLSMGGNCIGDDLVESEVTSMSYEYVSDDNLSYALYTPSSASSNVTTPLIVWLHGSGEVGLDKVSFKSSGLLYLLDRWNLDYFNAYILCPHLSSGTWNTETTKTKFYNLLNSIIQNKAINTDKIILSGHSLGAQGIYNIANGNLNYYSALVFLSPFSQDPSDIDISQFTSVPVRGYVGKPIYGENENSYYHATNAFQNTFGADALTIFDTAHSTVPDLAFNEDNDDNNKSDLIEWMLSQ